MYFIHNIEGRKSKLRVINCWSLLSKPFIRRMKSATIWDYGDTNLPPFDAMWRSSRLLRFKFYAFDSMSSKLQSELLLLVHSDRVNTGMFLCCFEKEGFSCFVFLVCLCVCLWVFMWVWKIEIKSVCVCVCVWKICNKIGQ